MLEPNTSLTKGSKDKRQDATSLPGGESAPGPGERGRWHSGARPLGPLRGDAAEGYVTLAGGAEEERRHK